MGHQPASPTIAFLGGTSLPSNPLREGLFRIEGISIPIGQRKEEREGEREREDLAWDRYPDDGVSAICFTCFAYFFSSLYTSSRLSLSLPCLFNLGIIGGWLFAFMLLSLF